MASVMSDVHTGKLLPSTARPPSLVQTLIRDRFTIAVYSKIHVAYCRLLVVRKH
jgi:hypothetical protein